MKRRGAALAILLLLAGGLALGSVLSRPPEERSPVAAGRPSLPEASPSAEAALLDEVRRELRRSYYRPVAASVLGQTSVAKVLRALGDPHTEYLNPAQYDVLRRHTARSYSGVGLTVGPASGGLIVTSALEGPAREAGIRRGDVIVSIDGSRTRKLSFHRALGLIKGREGTVVRLTVQRPDAGVIHFTVVRQEVPVPALRSRLIRVRESKIGYVRLLSFPESAAERVGRATEILRDKGAKGLILDLRDNPGGLLSQAVGAAGLYLEEGVVCTIEGEHQERRVYEVKGAASFPRLPLVVLVNHGSASAAEILAAALSDHDRASLVGDRTYGKASVQSVKELPSGGALKLTTATYRTPAGQDIARRGVEPDFAGTDDPLTRPDEGVIAAEAALFKLFET